MTKKITPYQYAIFLYEITREKSEVPKMINGFLGILAKNNDLGKIEDIVMEFETYEKKQAGITDVELISAKPLSSAIKNQIVELVKDHGKPEIKETIDPDLLGGIALIVGDTMIDGSLRRRVKDLEKLLSSV